MTLKAALFELLDGVGASPSHAVRIDSHALAQWSDEAVAALKAQKIIRTARPASSTVCPGCEQQCVMPVHTIPAPPGDPALFVVCDKRSDINRVDIPPARLTQWQASTPAVARFIADSLSLRFSGKRQDNERLLEIGMAPGNKRTQMLGLRCDGELALVAGSSRIPLAEAFQFADGRYTLDAGLIRQLVDASTTGDARYTPGQARREVRKLETAARRESWRKAYRALKKKRPHMSDVWYSRRIANMEVARGRAAETIRKQLQP